MNDHEWDDYVRRNKYSPYARVRDVSNPAPGVPSGPGGNRGGGLPTLPGGVVTPREPGFFDEFLKKVGDATVAICRTVPPLNWIYALGDWLLERSGWPTKIAFGIVSSILVTRFAYAPHEAGSFAAAFIGAVRGLLGHFTVFAAILGGFIGGVMVTRLTGLLILTAVGMTVYFSLIGLMLVGLWCAYALVALVTGWPIPFV